MSVNGNGVVDVNKLDADEQWLRGYFNVERNDRPSRDESPRKWKNIDFLRLRDVALHLLDPQPGDTVLDIGCHTGATMVYCGLQGATVHGVDLDAKAIAAANTLLKRYKLSGEATCSDAAKLPYDRGMFDGVITSDFVEHVTDEVKVEIFREALRVMKPGGKFVIKTPNLAYAKVSLRFKQLRAVLKGENPFELVIPHTPGTEDPQHIGLTTRWGLRDALVAAGFVNYTWAYAPLRRFGQNRAVEVLSTEVPIARDYLCEDLYAVAYKPIVLSHFPD